MARLRKTPSSTAKDIHQVSPTHRSPSKNGLLTFAQLPAWLQDNVYLQTGYRPPSGSIWLSLKSSFSLHNETVNIQSHLIGAFVFFALSTWPYLVGLPSPPFPLLTLPMNQPGLLPFYAGAVTCLTLSASYHATSNVSLKVAQKGNQADYLGILALIIGSFISSILYGFHCHPSLQIAYCVMIGSIGLACAIVTVNPGFRTPEWRTFRATMFVAMGLSAVIPVIHGLRLYGIEGMEDRIGLRWLVAQGITYILGASIYARRIPEKWYPGTFDIFGASHQIFHVFVLAAAGLHLIGLLRAAEHMAGEGGRCEDIM